MVFVCLMERLPLTIIAHLRIRETALAMTQQELMIHLQQKWIIVSMVTSHHQAALLVFLTYHAQIVKVNFLMVVKNIKFTVLQRDTPRQT